jgi:hypothetical protein
VEAACFSNPSVKLQFVMTHNATVLILSTVKTSDLTSVVCVHIVDDIFGFRVVTMIGVKCNSVTGRVFTCSCKLVQIVVHLLAACLGAVCCPQLLERGSSPCPVHSVSA